MRHFLLAMVLGVTSAHAINEEASKIAGWRPWFADMAFSLESLREEYEPVPLEDVPADDLAAYAARISYFGVADPFSSLNIKTMAFRDVLIWFNPDFPEATKQYGDVLFSEFENSDGKVEFLDTGDTFSVCVLSDSAIQANDFVIALFSLLPDSVAGQLRDSITGELPAKGKVSTVGEDFRNKFSTSFGATPAYYSYYVSGDVFFLKFVGLIQDTKNPRAKPGLIDRF